MEQEKITTHYKVIYTYSVQKSTENRSTNCKLIKGVKPIILFTTTHLNRSSLVYKSKEDPSIICHLNDPVYPSDTN